MSREISDDLKLLEQFIRDFNLSGVSGNQELINKVKPMHKKLYSLMTFVVEVDHVNATQSVISENGLNFLKESISDLGQALFCWIQGAYKPSSLILRSSIETFIKSISGEEILSVYQEKSMYKVFDIAKEISCFKSDFGKTCFTSLHSTYKDLCKIVHAATFDNMAHISALKSFPIFSENEANSLFEDFIKITTTMLSVLYLLFYKFTYTMHPKNQSNFLDGIPKASKKIINENFC